jgi:hypothetical protein
MKSFVLLLIVLAVTSVTEADESDFERVLVPVVATELEGASGSLWRTELLVSNSGDAERVVAQFPDQPCWILCSPTVVGPHSVRHQSAQKPLGNEGAFLYLEEPSEPLSLHLRVIERSDGWGTVIPIVRERDFRTRQRLLNVPTDPRFRVRIRIYDFEGHDALPVLLRGYSFRGMGTPTDHLLAETEVILTHAPFEGSSPQFPPYPADGSMMLDQFLTIPSEHDRVWVEISSDRPVWGFVTVTDNVTHRVTLITPEQD